VSSRQAEFYITPREEGRRLVPEGASTCRHRREEEEKKKDSIYLQGGKGGEAPRLGAIRKERKVGFHSSLPIKSPSTVSAQKRNKWFHLILLLRGRGKGFLLGHSSEGNQ